MDTGQVTLDVYPLMQTSETVWAVPDNVSVTPLLDDGSNSIGNAVLQSSGLTVLTKTIGWSTDDKAVFDGLLALRYAGTTVVYIDPEGDAAFVVITSLSAQRTGRSLWEGSATLVQPPATSGS